MTKELNFDIDHLYSLEQAILGSILVDNSDELRYLVLKHNLLPQDFRNEHHYELFNAILKCWKDGNKVDLVTITGYRPTAYRNIVYGEANSKNWDYLNVQIMQTITSGAHIEQHIMKFKEYIFAQFWNKISESIGNINWSGRDVLEVSDNILNKYNNIHNRLTKNLTKEAKNDYENEITQKFYNFTNGIATGVTTGSEEVDTLFKGGFTNGELIIIAGRPGMLKTTTALIMAWESHKKGNAVTFFSLEMPISQLKNKIISKELGISYDKMKIGNITMDELGMITMMNKKIDESSFNIYNDFQTIDDIVKKTTELKEDGNVDLIVIDYIQRIKHKQKDLRQGITYITRELKSIATSSYIPVVALSQLSRAVEGRINKRPILSDLKESSSIEEDADIVVFPYRDAYYKNQANEDIPKADMWKVEFNIGKGRDIGIGSTLLNINPITLSIDMYNPFNNSQ